MNRAQSACSRPDSLGPCSSGAHPRRPCCTIMARARRQCRRQQRWCHVGCASRTLPCARHASMPVVQRAAVTCPSRSYSRHMLPDAGRPGAASRRPFHRRRQRTIVQCLKQQQREETATIDTTQVSQPRTHKTMLFLLGQQRCSCCVRNVHNCCHEMVMTCLLAHPGIDRDAHLLLIWPPCLLLELPRALVYKRCDLHEYLQ